MPEAGSPPPACLLPTCSWKLCEPAFLNSIAAPRSLRLGPGARVTALTVEPCMLLPPRSLSLRVRAMLG